MGEDGSGEPIIIKATVCMNIVSDQAFGTFYPYLGALVAERVVGRGHPLRDAPDLAEELHLCGGEY